MPVEAEVAVLPDDARRAMLTMQLRRIVSDADAAEATANAVDVEAATVELRERLDRLVEGRRLGHATRLASLHEEAASRIREARTLAAAILDQVPAAQAAAFAAASQHEVSLVPLVAGRSEPLPHDGGNDRQSQQDSALEALTAEIIAFDEVAVDVLAVDSSDAPDESTVDDATIVTSDAVALDIEGDHEPVDDDGDIEADQDAEPEGPVCDPVELDDNHAVGVQVDDLPGSEQGRSGCENAVIFEFARFQPLPDERGMLPSTSSPADTDHPSVRSTVDGRRHAPRSFVDDADVELTIRPSDTAAESSEVGTRHSETHAPIHMGLEAGDSVRATTNVADALDAATLMAVVRELTRANTAIAPALAHYPATVSPSFAPAVPFDPNTLAAAVAAAIGPLLDLHGRTLTSTASVTPQSHVIQHARQTKRETGMHIDVILSSLALIIVLAVLAAWML